MSLPLNDLQVVKICLNHHLIQSLNFCGFNFVLVGSFLNSQHITDFSLLIFGSGGGRSCSTRVEIQRTPVTNYSSKKERAAGSMCVLIKSTS